MQHSIASTAIPSPLRRSELPDKAAGKAKASLRKPELSAKGTKELTWADLGWCLGYVMRERGFNLDEFARELGRDPRHVKRMIDAIDRPQIELCWPDRQNRCLLIVGMAKRGGGFDVQTTLILGES